MARVIVCTDQGDVIQEFDDLTEQVVASEDPGSFAWATPVAHAVLASRIGGALWVAKQADTPASALSEREAPDLGEFLTGARKVTRRRPVTREARHPRRPTRESN